MHLLRRSRSTLAPATRPDAWRRLMARARGIAPALPVGLGKATAKKRRVTPEQTSDRTGARFGQAGNWNHRCTRIHTDRCQSRHGPAKPGFQRRYAPKPTAASSVCIRVHPWFHSWTFAGCLVSLQRPDSFGDAIEEPLQLRRLRLVHVVVHEPRHLAISRTHCTNRAADELAGGIADTQTH